MLPALALVRGGEEALMMLVGDENALSSRMQGKYQVAFI